MVAWGLVMTLMCLVNSYKGLIMSVKTNVDLRYDAHLHPPVHEYSLDLLKLGYSLESLFNSCDIPRRLSNNIYTGVNYYISLWYPRSERAMRVAIFFSAATVAGSSISLL